MFIRPGIITAVLSIRVAEVIAGDITSRVHEIGQPGGNNFGQTSVVDADRDGDLHLLDEKLRVSGGFAG